MEQTKTTFLPGEKLWWHGPSRTVPVTYVRPGRTAFAEVLYGHVEGDEPHVYSATVDEKNLRSTP